MKRKSALLFCFLIVLIFMGSGCDPTEPVVEKFVLSINTIGQGEVHTEPHGESFNEGTEVVLTAVPHEGYLFEEWQGDVQESDGEVITVLMDTDRTITAVFLKEEETGPRTPVMDEEVKGTAVEKGQTLAHSELTGTFKDPVTDHGVEGTLAWTDETQIVEQTQDFSWTFTPHDTEAYKTVTGYAQVRIEPLEGTEITIGLPVAPDCLDPREAISAMVREPMYVIMEPLLMHNTEMELEPRLARSWQVDGNTISFWLRDATWHDGTPFTAEDVRYTFDYLMNRGSFTTIDSLTVERDDLIHFHLQDAFPAFLHELARQPVAPAHADSIDDFGQNPIGTGPYQLLHWEGGDSMELEAFEEYWGGSPITQKLTFFIVEDDHMRLLLFQNGDIDIYTGGIFAPELPNLETDPDYLVQRVPGQAYTFLGMNVQSEPLNDPLLRRALNHLIDRETIIDHALDGIGIPASSPIPPSLPTHNLSVEEFYFDPSQAQAYLEEGGYAPGEVELDLYVAESFHSRIFKAEELAYEAEQVGIHLEIHKEPLNVLVHRLLNTDDYDLFIMGWGSLVSSHGALYGIFHSQGSHNLSNHSNELLDALLEEGKTLIPHTAAYDQTYREAQEMIVEDCIYGFINYTETISLQQAYVTGFTVHPMRHNAWMYAHNLQRME